MSHKRQRAMTHDPSVGEDADTSPAKLGRRMRTWRRTATASIPCCVRVTKV
jgi:hypothetical protein